MGFGRSVWKSELAPLPSWQTWPPLALLPGQTQVRVEGEMVKRDGVGSSLTRKMSGEKFVRGTGAEVCMKIVCLA